MYFFFVAKNNSLHLLTHSNFLAGKKKYTREKKNTLFLLTHSISDENVAKVNFSKEKKNTVPLDEQKCVEKQRKAFHWAAKDEKEVVRSETEDVGSE